MIRPGAHGALVNFPAVGMRHVVILETQQQTAVTTTRVQCAELDLEFGERKDILRADTAACSLSMHLRHRGAPASAKSSSHDDVGQGSCLNYFEETLNAKLKG